MVVFFYQKETSWQAAHTHSSCPLISFCFLRGSINHKKHQIIMMTLCARHSCFMQSFECAWFGVPCHCTIHTTGRYILCFPIFCVDIILFICWQKGLVDADAHQQLNVPDPLLLPNPFLQLQKFTKKVCVVTHYIMYTSARWSEEENCAYLAPT